MRRVSPAPTIISAIAICLSARAGITQTVVLPSGTYLNLDIGMTASGIPDSGAYDVEWIDGTILPRGQCKVANLGVRTARQSGLSAALSKLAGAYYVPMPVGSIPSTGETFTFTGSGGKDVGSFTSTVNLSNPLLTWTNSSTIASVNKNQGLHVTWTGGNPGAYVLIAGASTVRVNKMPVVGNFECKVPVEAGEFTVPSYILQALPDGQGDVAFKISFRLRFPRADWIPRAPAHISGTR